MTDQLHSYYRENREQNLLEMESNMFAMRQASIELMEQNRLKKDDQFEGWLQCAWDRFVEWIPDLPYIGGDKNFNTGNLVFGAWLLCVYRELRQHGYTDEQVGLLLYKTVLAKLPPVPGMPPSPDEVAEIIVWRRDQAQYSMLHKYPYDWQTTFVEGDSAVFDWGVDYQTCGICKLFKEHGVLDFLPYACFIDLPSYRSKGIGLVRTKTLSKGDDRCDFRFNLRGEYHMEWYPDFARD